MRKIHAFILGVLLVYPLAKAHQQNLPESRFELPYLPDAASAERDYRSLLDDIAHLTAEQKPPDCRSDRFKHAIESGKPWHSCRFFSSFPEATQTAADKSANVLYGWAPAAAVADAIQHVARLQEQAGKGTLSACDGDVCEVVVKALDSTEGEEVLAACKAIRDAHDGVTGAPWQCVPVAIIAKGSIWIKIVTGYTEIGNRTLGLPDFDLAVISKDSIPEIPAFLANAENALSSAPLTLIPKLDVKGSGFGTLFGTSQYVPSQVLQAYRPRVREMATVSIEAFRANEQGLTCIRLSVSTNVLVNTLASTDPNDWHRPSPAQEGDYVKAVQANLKKYLEQSCHQPLWRTSHVITCGLANDAPLPAWALQE